MKNKRLLVDSKDKDPASPDYLVGYKKPPLHSRFKPGQSGNPRGRPKKTQTVFELIQKHLRKKVTVTIGDKPQKLPMAEAIAIKQISLAVKGDHKSTKFVMDALAGSDADSRNKLPELLQQFRAIHASRSTNGRKRVQQSARSKNSDNPGDDHGA